MKIIIFIGIIAIFVFFPNITFFFISNFHHIAKWSFIDIYYYFKHKKYNLCKEYGMIRLNTASTNQVFGCGKTLLLVIRAFYIYNKYNNKFVYDEVNKKFVIQKVHIISNVELFGIPYVKFSSVNQLIEIDKFGYPDQDVTIFLLDESGAIFNSRNYRDNISTDLLTRLLQSRKNKMALYMTSQRFAFTDKILREVCNEVTTCRKWWRIVKTVNYNAYDLENAINPDLVKPLSTRYYFIFNSDYSKYNSYQLVEELRKDYKPGDYLNTSEILQNYGSNDGSLENVSRPSRKAKRRIINTFK